MADGKNIEIKIAATGADQAAAEVRKVEAAVTGFGGMLDGVPERADEAAQSVTKIGKSAEQARSEAQKASSTFGEMSDSMEDASEKADTLDANVGKIARAQRAQAIAQLAEAFGKVGKAVRETADEIGVADPALGATFRKTADGIDQVSSKAQALALGFAAGGPVGAGLALVGTLTADFVVELVKMGAAEDAAAAAAARAAEMQTKLNLAIAGVRDPAAEAAAASAKLSARYGEETAALREANAELNRRNQLLDAQAAEKGAARDLQDQRAIAAGAPEEDVKARRALDDAADQKARIDQKLNDEADLLNKRFRTNQEGRGQLETDQRAGAQSPDDLTARENALRAEEAKLAQDLADFRNRQLLAGSEKRGIDSRATATVERLGGDKSSRLQEERERADRQAQQEQERRERNLESDRAAAGRAGRDAERLLPKGVSDQFRGAIEKASANLQDGGTAAELAELAQLLSQLGASTNGAVSSVKSELAAVKAQIAQLQKKDKLK
jgi:colicin import membrane protein